jgi:hypothetical protein
MRRVIGTVLLGLGIALAVFAAGLRFYVAPLGTNIPYDLEPSTTLAESPNSTWLSAGADGATVKTGKLISSTDVRPQPVLTRDKLPSDLQGKAVIWDVYSQIKDTDGHLVSGSSTEFALDRKTGSYVQWDGTWVNDGGSATKVSYEGNSYKLPFYTKKQTYLYWDDNAGKASDLYFVRTETIGGLEAYVFEQSYNRVKANVSDDTLTLLSAVVGDGSDKGAAYYSTTRTLWVEPVTGQFLNVRETPHAWYETTTEDGTVKTITMLRGKFEYTEQSKAEALETIKANRDLLQLVSVTLPATTGGAGVVLLIVGIVLLASGRRPQGAHEAPAGA